MMQKLTPQQKQLVVQKLRQLRADPGFLEKYDRDGDGVVSEYEWERVRREVIRQVLREPSSRAFEVSPLLRQQHRSGLIGLLINHREGIATLLMVLGLAMMALDPGFYLSRGEAPGAWGEGGLFAQLTLAQHWLNWTSQGWSGFVTLLFGAVWGKWGHVFID
ncbi:MAG: hypothetical protein HQK87_07280 [Nitrospinae bacterium]|nr:hypothetical protein [Nitrospinota bacterium]